MAGRKERAPRLPGMFSIDQESDPDRLKSIRLHGALHPLKILVDQATDGKPARHCTVSPGLRSSGRSESVEARNRKRTRDWLEGKTGQGSGGRVRSASAGRDKRTEMAARYWALLIENLRRAVDDLYRTCEGDESCLAAREVVMVLENYTKEFSDLINWLKLKTEYENTPQPQRPTSLAWDIRKTSPLGKGTPASTPGKLTPSRHLLLASPAKRQLNFDAENKENSVTSRSRTVSETIKEVGLEVEYSPQTAPSLERQEEEQLSEHEKSDSEQEKDVTPVNEAVTDILASVVENAVCDIDARKVDKAEKEEPAKETPEKKSKKPGAPKSKVKASGSKSLPGSASTCLATAARQEPASKATSSTAAKPTAATGSSSASKPCHPAGPKQPVPTKAAVQPGPTRHVATTFASTVKTSLHPTKPGAAPAPAAKPRLTRSVTAIAPKPRPPPARRTAAGLLITTTPRPKTSAGRAAAPAVTLGSPKQQRISLVARQAKFAVQNQKPHRRAPATQGKGKAAKAEDAGPPGSSGLHGSATSLSSGGSGRSWADCVRGATAQEDRPAGLHCSAEDLGSGVPGRQVADAEGWCTVRRARKSPGTGGQARGGRAGYSAGARYRLPSSAISMPSLALGDGGAGEEEETAAVALAPSRPRLEKSSSSASMVGAREPSQAMEPFLAQLGEERAGGVSDESLSDTEPGTTKKKKDELNENRRQAALLGKGPLGKAASCPLAGDQGGSVHLHTADVHTEEGGKGGELRDVEDFEARDKAIAIAELEVSDLQREITETEQAELTDTDCDIDCGTDTDTADTDTADSRSEIGAASDITFISRYEKLLDSLSWAEQLELEEQLGDPSNLPGQLPGRNLNLHEKLSSPARKKEPHETFLHHQEKQARARARRIRFSEEKSSRLAVLNTRIEEAMEQRDKLVDERKDVIDTKLRRAEENRTQHIEGIRRKAHEEEEKLKEIAFINSLQAQNARMDMITQVETADEKCEERLAEIAGERAKKAELRRRGAEEAEERRRAMEESRQKQIDLMISRRKEKESRIQEVQAVAREQRKVSAAMKDKERLERLSTVRAAESVMKEELQEKIQQKQEEAAKRHAEYLEHIQQKAWELSLLRCSSDQGAVPVIKPYIVQKKCNVCNVLIKSEVHLLSHLRGRQHETAIEGKTLSLEERNSVNLRNILDAAAGEADPGQLAARERQRAARRRAKKLKVRMAVRAAEYEAGLPAPNKHLDSPNRARIGKSIKEIEKLLGSQGKGAWPNNSVSSLERAFGEIVRSLDRNNVKDQDVFFALGGFETMWKIYQMLGECQGESTCVIPLKSLVSAGKVVARAAAGHPGNTSFLLLSNRLALITDILLARLGRLEAPPAEDPAPGPDTDPLSASLMVLLSSVIQQLADAKPREREVTGRLQDLVSYIVCSGTVDSLAGYFQLVRDPIDSSPAVAEFLLTSLQLLTGLTAAVEAAEDPTQLLVALQGTELAGTVSMLYGMLLHQGRDSDRTEGPASLPAHTLAVVSATCTLLHRLVRDRAKVALIQGVLGQEGISLEFRHIASYLLYYCQHHSQGALLNQVIVLVGYFTANHPDNQAIVQSGSQPSVLQQLANLPFQFFSQPELKAVLFPTLLSCCHGNPENTAILGLEMSWQLIDDFVASEEGREDRLVGLVVGPDKEEA